MNINITILVDNRAADGLLSEHGFSLWIDTGYECILFDTGQGDILLSPCHCTGNRAAEALKEAFGDQIIPGYAGARYDF